MSREMEHARLLRDRGRHDEAVAAVMGHLARHPDDPSAHLELALNRMEIPGELSRALEDARRTTGLMPEESFPLALQSRILSRLERPKEALKLAEAAIAIEPESGFAWNSKCIALVGMSRWKEAEDCAREALALDPDDENASNLLAHTLRVQNRLDESEEESRRRLARDPENAFSFANAGWAALQRGKIGEAENLFKESLRIDPDLEHAKEGLKHSYRARSAFFRLFLKWSFFIARFSEKHRFALIIGLIIGFKLLRTVAAAIHPLLVVPVIFVYFLFVFGTWLSGGIANFLLLRDPVARLSLDGAEKADGLATGLLFFGGVAVCVGGLIASIHAVAMVGACLIVASIPATLICGKTSPVGRLVFSALGISILVSGILTAVEMAAQPGTGPLEGQAGTCFNVMLISLVACTWLASVPALRRQAE